MCFTESCHRNLVHIVQNSELFWDKKKMYLSIYEQSTEILCYFWELLGPFGSIQKVFEYF